MTSDHPFDVYQFGEFTLDLGARVLFHDAQERRLSPKALQLLQMLIQSKPRALSRRELYDALWPDTFVCETNLTSLVKELRRALDDAPYIRTVHGFGYAFSAEVTNAPPARPVAGLILFHGAPHPLYSGKNTVGRAMSNDVMLSDETVSRRHATITIAGTSVEIEDHKSTNGTFVDGVRVGSTCQLGPESRVSFGRAEVVIVLSRNPSSTAPWKTVPPPSRAHFRG